MKIWFIHQYAVPASRAGGTRHFSVAQELRRGGHDVTLVASGVHYQSGTESVEFGERNEIREQVEGVAFLWIRCREYSGNSFGRLRNMLGFGWSVLRSRALTSSGRPDVIVGSSPQPFAALAGLLLARRYRCRFVYEVRDLWPQTLIELGRMSRAHPLVIAFSLIERWCARAADCTITLLEHSTSYLESLGAAPGSVTCIPNGVDLAMAGCPSPPPARREVVFMYAGAHGLANNLRTLIEAAAILNSQPEYAHVRVRLVGDGPERPALQRFAVEIGATNVSFTSSVPKHEVYGILREADCFILILRDSPVFHRGISPNKLYDYMAMARPVLFAVNTPTNPIAAAEAGVSANPNSASDIAEAMATLAAMPPAARAEMGSRARRYVELHHAVSDLARRYADVLVDG